MKNEIKIGIAALITVVVALVFVWPFAGPALDQMFANNILVTVTVTEKEMFVFDDGKTELVITGTLPAGKSVKFNTSMDVYDRAVKGELLIVEGKQYPNKSILVEGTVEEQADLKK